MGLCMKWEIHMDGPSDNSRNTVKRNLITGRMEIEGWPPVNKLSYHAHYLEGKSLLGLLHLVGIQIVGSPDNIRI